MPILAFASVHFHLETFSAKLKQGFYEYSSKYLLNFTMISAQKEGTTGMGEGKKENIICI